MEAAAKNPLIDQQISESYYYDEDIGASCSFDITNMQELIAIMSFYAGRDVNMVLDCEVVTDEMKTQAYLENKRSTAYSIVKESSPMSAETVAQKLRAIANAITA